jgi:prepilin-type N-terminal cleavage/methylation domain-containing protein
MSRGRLSYDRWPRCTYMPLQTMKRKRYSRGFTLVEIMVVVSLIAVLLMIAIPNYIGARARSEANACISQLRQIEDAKDRWAMEKHKTSGDIVSQADIVPNYVKTMPACPGGGTLTINPVGTSATCTIVTHKL